MLSDAYTELSAKFTHWAGLEVVATSPLYQHLAGQIAHDPAILEIASATREGQPHANMLFGAVHYLLLSGIQHRLGAYYASVSDVPALTGDAFPAFRDFCLTHADAIREQLRTRRTQTNEVRRSTILMPMFAYFAKQTNAPLHLIEVGASAGFNMLWDRYQYHYTRNGETHIVGAADAPLTLTCAVTGDMPLPTALPVVAWRAGIDLNPLDVRDPDTLLWLRALVWPEHQQRMADLQRAAALVTAAPPQIYAGSALDILPELFSQLPPDVPVCVYHTHVLYQFSQEARAAFYDLLRTASQTRTIGVIAQEQLSTPRTQLAYRLYTDGALTQHMLAAYPHDHGAWIEWVWQPET
ncbi:MAG: DUF2332 domain-containing protein [Armatimonadetes bacterium]|nr:DUF2332 domain-containing protein [Anaerolineae bacterium]